MKLVPPRAAQLKVACVPRQRKFSVFSIIIRGNYVFSVLIIKYKYVLFGTMIWPLLVISVFLLTVVQILRKILRPKIVEYYSQDFDVSLSKFFPQKFVDINTRFS